MKICLAAAMAACLVFPVSVRGEWVPFSDAEAAVLTKAMNDLGAYEKNRYTREYHDPNSPLHAMKANAEKILRETLTISGDPLHLRITCTPDLSKFPLDGWTLEELVREADRGNIDAAGQLVCFHMRRQLSETREINRGLWSSYLHGRKYLDQLVRANVPGSRFVSSMYNLSGTPGIRPEGLDGYAEYAKVVRSGDELMIKLGMLMDEPAIDRLCNEALNRLKRYGEEGNLSARRRYMNLSRLTRTPIRRRMLNYADNTLYLDAGKLETRFPTDLNLSRAWCVEAADRGNLQAVSYWVNGFRKETFDKDDMNRIVPYLVSLFEAGYFNNSTDDIIGKPILPLMEFIQSYSPEMTYEVDGIENVTHWHYQRILSRQAKLNPAWTAFLNYYEESLLARGDEYVLAGRIENFYYERDFGKIEAEGFGQLGEWIVRLHGLGAPNWFISDHKRMTWPDALFNFTADFKLLLDQYVARGDADAAVVLADLIQHGDLGNEMRQKGREAWQQVIDLVSPHEQQGYKLFLRTIADAKLNMINPVLEQGENAPEAAKKQCFDDVAWLYAKLKGSKRNGYVGPACCLMGHLYETGFGVARDIGKAASFYEEGARHEHHQCLYRLGTFYEMGTTVEKDSARALKLYERSCKLGNSGAREAFDRLKKELDSQSK